MPSLRIDLGCGLTFESISAAQSHFDNILKKTKLGEDVPAKEFQELKALYEAYCNKTNWSLRSAPVGFFPKHETGKGFTTICFGVRFEDGSVDRFSLGKALSAVADRNP